MRSNVVSEASLGTRVGQWWGGITFITAAIVILCGAIYAIALLIGYDAFESVCFYPAMILDRFQVYRFYTATLFHASILHLLFNMLALVPIGSELERILGSVRYLHVVLVIATSNGLLHLLIAYILSNNPFHSFGNFIIECGIGFSGIIFAMIVMETSLSGSPTRSIFGLFVVPGKWYPWILLVLFQLLMPRVSLLGHLCGILSGFAYSRGLFNFMLFGSSVYSAIESSRLLTSCVRRQGFIVGGGMPTASLPTVVNTNSGLGLGNVWRRWRSWMPQRETPMDERFPGRGHTVGGTGVAASTRSRQVFDSDDVDLQTTLLDETNRHASRTQMQPRENEAGRPFLNQPSPLAESQVLTTNMHGALEGLVAMGFEEGKAAIALSAANGDLTIAVEILSSEN